ncbi:cytochrome ubiquinol oxidase subunit I [Azospirillum sp. TSO35-2]|uniref:cytochrome ubiquinol oxidase subunit I n=1 Tax=Azospirillum sp. TSO35-2 TaxID=716796 RepID=UPI001FFF40AB|nr:cytochrome ubiquinol oxidase subunit I [Azospirillum sp. TSO35-2]
MPWRAIGQLSGIPFGTLHTLFARWTRLGLSRRLLDRLRRAWRLTCGDMAKPNTVVTDSRTCRSVPTCFARGVDGGKKLRGVKLHIAVENTVFPQRSMRRRRTSMTPPASCHTEPAPAGFTLIGLPNNERMETEHAIKLPWLLGLIATRSTDREVTGLIDLTKQHEQRIRSGMIAYANLEKLRAGDRSDQVVGAFEAHKADLGYGLLLKRYTDAVVDATDAQIALAARDTIPPVAPLFFGFRIMVALGFTMLFLIAAAFWFNMRRTIAEQRWLLRALVLAIPLPWIACELGWFVAEFGRQPWAIGEVLPTFLATSSLTTGDLIFSLAGFLTFYTMLLAIEMFLMVRFARKGPASLGTGRYHGERDSQPSGGPHIGHGLPHPAE